MRRLEKNEWPISENYELEQVVAVAGRNRTGPLWSVTVEL